MKQTCPFFGKCGGCKYDFTSPAYRENKLRELSDVSITGEPVWNEMGGRWRGDFCFADGRFGLFAKHSKDIVPVRFCPLMMDEINNILPKLADLPWIGAGSCLVTKCENGIDICITSNIDYFTPEFKNAANNLPAIRVTWNGRALKQTDIPKVKFGDKLVEYPSGAFLQPIPSEVSGLRDLVVSHASGMSKVADLFCGLGNFTFELNADGFDIVGVGARRDLFKNPLTVRMLAKYDCVIMDPPRAGALAQCKELIKSDVKRVIYVSCNPNTFARDRYVLLCGGYKTKELIPVDQFVGSVHWELFSVFEK